MQNNRNRRPVQSAYVPAGRRPRASAASRIPSVTLLAALCVILPPVGVMLLWRAEKVSLPVRIGFSALGFVAMLLIFCWFMRPADISMDILPTPATPQYAGYGRSGSVQYPAMPMATEITAPPSAPSAPDMSYEQPEVSDPQELTDESIVYAVTNNASSFHLYEICDFQENRRALTLREALNEGLVPCEKCVGAAG